MAVSFFLDFDTLNDLDFGLGLAYCLIFPYCSRRLLQPGAAGECQDQASVSELGPGWNYDGHVVFLYNCGVLLWPELLPSVQPPPQDGWIRHLNSISFSRILFSNKYFDVYQCLHTCFSSLVLYTWGVVLRSLKQPQEGWLHFNNKWKFYFLLQAIYFI